MWMSWVLGSRLGQWVAGAFGLIVTLFAVYLRGRADGRQSEQSEQDRNTLERMRDRKVVDDEIESLSAAERRRRLDYWVQD